MTNINTAPFFDKVRTEQMWPPGPYSTNRLMIALLPFSVVEDNNELLAELDLVADDWFQHGGYGPCLILGECVVGSSGKYYPKPSYPLKEVAYQTKLYREPQRQQEAKKQQRIEREMGIAAAQEERAKHWMASVENQRLELERKEQELKNLRPEAQYKRIVQLEKEVKDQKVLLAETKKIAELALAELKKLNERESLAV